MKCEYGCNKEAEYFLEFKTTINKWCCSDHFNKCEEVRQKNSNSNKGEKNHFYGKNHTEKSRKQICKSLIGKNSGNENPFYGKKHTKETRLKISISCTGKNLLHENPNWKGGLSFEDYCMTWSDKEFRSFIKERDGHKCLNPMCSYKDPFDICLHHINYNKKDCDPNNIITLCRSCNCSANYNREWHKSWYEAIMHKRRVI
jgi:hypothetical protein